MRASPRALAFAAALIAAAPLAALAAAPMWYAVTGSSGGEIARWGIPQTDAVGFEVSCQEGGVVVRPALFAMEEPAAVPAIRFSVDGEPYLRDGQLDFSERDGAWQASALIQKDDALVAAMRRGSKLTYDFEPRLREGDAFTLSLSGSAKAIDAALGSC